MYTDLFRRPTLRISMQYFADPEGGEGADGGTDTFAENAADKKPTLKELLASNKAYQSEFDKMSSKAQETAIANARAKWEADAKAQADEAAKLAKMKADEKEEYQRKQREDALAKREAEITRRGDIRARRCGDIRTRRQNQGYRNERIKTKPFPVFTGKRHCCYPNHLSVIVGSGYPQSSGTPDAVIMNPFFSNTRAEALFSIIVLAVMICVSVSLYT